MLLCCSAVIRCRLKSSTRGSILVNTIGAHTGSATRHTASRDGGEWPLGLLQVLSVSAPSGTNTTIPSMSLVTTTRQPSLEVFPTSSRNG